MRHQHVNPTIFTLYTPVIATKQSDHTTNALQLVFALSSLTSLEGLSNLTGLSLAILKCDSCVGSCHRNSVLQHERVPTVLGYSR